MRKNYKLYDPTYIIPLNLQRELDTCVQSCPTQLCDDSNRFAVVRSQREGERSTPSSQRIPNSEPPQPLQLQAAICSFHDADTKSKWPAILLGPLVPYCAYRLTEPATDPANL